MRKNQLSVLVVDITATAPTYTAYFCDALNRTDGVRATIFGINRKDETMHLTHLAIQYRYLLNISYKLQTSLLRIPARVIEALINWLWLLFIAPHYDIIHIQWLPGLRRSSAELLLLRLLLLRNDNTCYTVHNTLPHDQLSAAVRRRFQELYNIIPRLVVHTDKTKKELINDFGLIPSKITVMPHGPLFAELRPESVVRRDDSVIAMLGAIQPYKGVEDAIEVLRALHQRGRKDIRLLLAGNSPKNYAAFLQQLIYHRGLESKVTTFFRYLPTPEMIKLYESSRVVLAPYRRIDQSGAVITALSLGTPVVAYRVGGLCDVIVDGYNGRLVPPGDIHGLADAVEWVLKQPPEELAKACRASVERFSWTKAGLIMKKLYLSMIQGEP